MRSLTAGRALVLGPASSVGNAMFKRNDRTITLFRSAPGASMTQQYPAPPPPPGQPPLGPQWLPQGAPPPPPPKKSHGKLAAAGLLITGLFAACAVTSTGSTPAPPKSTVGTATSPSVGVAAEPAADPAPAPLQPARKITSREWQLIAKDPDGHTGERLIVYGEVVQFDATTGGNGFRANVDGAEHKPKYGYADYKTNTILHSEDASLLANVVENDLFKAEVTVAGAKSYETTMGGTLTAPQLTVTKIESIGQVD